MIAVVLYTGLLWLLLYSVINCEPLNVHLIPHTHDDVGYRKTIDQYYYGGIVRVSACRCISLLWNDLLLK